MAVLLPVKTGESLGEISVRLRSSSREPLTLSLLGSARSGNFTPDYQFDSCTVEVNGEEDYGFEFTWLSDRDQYVFLAFDANANVEIALTDSHLPGIMTVFNSLNARVARHTRQVVDGDYGVDEFDFWLPRRHPHQVMPAHSFSQPMTVYRPENV